MTVFLEGELTLSDFKVLSFCGPSGPCFYYIIYKQILVAIRLMNGTLHLFLCKPQAIRHVILISYHKRWCFYHNLTFRFLCLLSNLNVCSKWSSIRKANRHTLVIEKLKIFCWQQFNFLQFHIVLYDYASIFRMGMIILINKKVYNSWTHWVKLLIRLYLTI